MYKSKKNVAIMITNLLDCSSSTGCAPPTLCTSIRPVREREREREREKKAGGGRKEEFTTHQQQLLTKLWCVAQTDLPFLPKF